MEIPYRSHLVEVEPRCVIDISKSLFLQFVRAKDTLYELLGLCEYLEYFLPDFEKHWESLESECSDENRCHLKLEKFFFAYIYAQANSNLGVCYRQQLNLQAARTCYQISIEWLKYVEIPNPSDVRDNFSSLVKSFHEKTVAKICSKGTELTEKLAIVYTNLAILFKTKPKYSVEKTKQIEYCLKAIEIYESLKDKVQRPDLYANTLGTAFSTFLLQCDYERAIVYLIKTMNLYSRSNIFFNTYSSIFFSDIGQFFYERFCYDDAITVYKKLYKTDMKIHGMYNLCCVESALYLGKANYFRRSWKSAKKWAAIALSIIQKTENVDINKRLTTTDLYANSLCLNDEFEDAILWWKKIIKVDIIEEYRQVIEKKIKNPKEFSESEKKRIPKKKNEIDYSKFNPGTFEMITKDFPQFEGKRDRESDEEFRKRRVDFVKSAISVNSICVALKNMVNKKNCANCGLVITKLSTCSNCRKRSYCSRKCQLEDWKIHKKECRCKKKQQEEK